MTQRTARRAVAAAFAAWTACAGVVGCRERAPDAPAAGDPQPGHAAPGAAAAPAAPAGPAPPSRPRILYPSAPGSFVDLIAGAHHGVVAIRAGSPVKSGPAAMFPGAPEATADVALGTGFLIDAHGVFVLTNDHIAAAAPELRVVLPDRTDVPARLLGRDTRLDLALLAVEAPGFAPLEPLVLGNSDELQVGEWLVVLGDPFGDEVSAAVGIVSATGRDAAGSLVAGGAMGVRGFLQTDARIHRGNSGGPVIDTAGQVVGVAIATGDRPGELSFAIPINRVKEVVDQLRHTGQVARSWLGARVQLIDGERAQAAGLPRPSGALVTEVRPGSPAAAAGLRVGDILLQWGERDADPRTLPWIVAQASAGRPVRVVVWRDHARLDATVVPQKMPE
ncbi:MAG TPA: trypsin-like peptidase domain-containing protein [Kofleriaceae bacterium]|nr:trypsin-like peptidase domain-containing protein [Kofleriaceae bacterium]